VSHVHCPRGWPGIGLTADGWTPLRVRSAGGASQNRPEAGAFGAGLRPVSTGVGMTDAQLFARLASSTKIADVSTFYNREVAESAIARTIALNRTQIETWLNGTVKNVQEFEGFALGNVGRLAARGSTTAIDVSGVRVVLIRDPSLGTGYRILTSYPIR
jgi:CDI toxin RNase A-like protein